MLEQNEIFLQPYKQAMQKIYSHLDSLKVLVRDNKSQQQRIAKLEQVIRKQITFSKNAIYLVKHKGSRHGRKEVEILEGKAFMDEIRILIALMEKEENDLLEDRTHMNEEEQRKFLFISYILIAGLLIILISIFLLIENNLRIRQKSEQLLKEKQEKLIEANRELEAFTYSVSHDLRAPLRSIHGYTQILMNDYFEKIDLEGKRTMNIIVKNASRMGLLIDDLLAFSRLGKTDLRKSLVDMEQLVRSVFAEVIPERTDKKISFKTGRLENAFADKSMMRQVWVNLLSNGVKYTSKKESPEIEVGSLKEEGKIIYYVKDNGVGFNMNYKHKLFNVFQRLHKIDEYEGTGVGLAIVYRIVKRHGGEVWADSVPDQRTTFYFSLPDKK